eukprot:GDKJ01034254.1.p1 GENE.GDKJ01034254.1~~GDKJ01034254.1.p1  ORF type:complete len:139 (+),score=21.61 GDKJ01034254.1:36-452(+)
MLSHFKVFGLNSSFSAKIRFNLSSQVRSFACKGSSSRKIVEEPEEEIMNYKVNRRENKLFITPKAILDTQQEQHTQNQTTMNTEKHENLEKITDFRTVADAFENDTVGSKNGEYGFRYKGPEPTKFGDWNIGGRCSDF